MVSLRTPTSVPSMPGGKLPGVIDLLAARLVRQLLLSRLSCVQFIVLVLSVVPLSSRLLLMEQVLQHWVHYDMMQGMSLMLDMTCQ